MKSMDEIKAAVEQAKQELDELLDLYHKLEALQQTKEDIENVVKSQSIRFKTDAVCECCGKPYTKTRKNSRYCSKECRDKAYKLYTRNYQREYYYVKRERKAK